MKDTRSVLVVDDEPNATRVLSMILKEEGYRVFESLSVDGAVGIIHNEDVDAIITDVKMPTKDGFQLFKYVSEHHPHIPVMFLTAYGTVDSAVNAMTRGAYYYFIKPPDYPQLKNVLAKAISAHSAHKAFEYLKRKTRQDFNVPQLVGTSPAIINIMRTIETVKDSDSNVLIRGDTGTGKEIIARSLHYLGKRCSKPFVALNCAAIPRDLIESELFGYEKGAFTGAATARKGKFEEAADGTLLLDEIGEIELSVQAKLLRVLQEREVERLGANHKHQVKFRLLSSTNKDLQKEVDEGRFREDLFYRINVVQIEIPPLSERREDIPLLASELLNYYSLRENRLFSFSDEVMDIFINCGWPGNVRQLKNIIERAVVLAKSERISVNELPKELLAQRRQNLSSDNAVKPLKVMELQAVVNAIQMCSGNKSKAARMLGISRKALYKRLRES